MGPDVVVLGGGSWGTALALHLVRQGKRTRLWVHDADLARALSSHHENSKYLPGYRLPSDLEITADMGQALTDARDVLLVVPSHHCRRVLQAARPHVTGGMGFCSASKGIEEGTLLRVSEVIRDVLGDLSAGGVAALSGPSFAREVAEGHPTAVVVSAGDREQGRRLQQLLSGGAVRVYTNDDLVGTEFGGALKNVIAIGAGAVEGLGYGSNTLAALLTRGLAEMHRLAEALGGRGETLAGLAGLGDLVLTCTGRLSRNRALGAALGRGKTLAQYQQSTPMIAEGVRTTASAHRLARREGISMPIVEQVHAVLYEDRPVGEAIRELLARPLTSEMSPGHGSTRRPPRH